MPDYLDSNESNHTFWQINNDGIVSSNETSDIVNYSNGLISYRVTENLCDEQIEEMDWKS